jgi:hypothetical protein
MYKLESGFELTRHAYVVWFYAREGIVTVLERWLEQGFTSL